MSRLSLSTILRLDAAASGAMGLLLLALAGALAEPLGLPAWLLREAGIVLVPWTALLLWIARAHRPSRTAVTAIALVNAAWVLGSVAVLGMFEPTAFGVAFVLAQAVAVCGFVVLQVMGMGRAVAMS